MDQLNNIYKILTVGIESYLNFTLKDYIIILLVILIFILRNYISNLFINRIKSYIKNRYERFDTNELNSLVSPIKFLSIILIFFTLTIYSSQNSFLTSFLLKINNSLITIFIFWVFHQLVNPFKFYIEKLNKYFSKSLVIWIISTLRYLLLFLGFVAVLDIWNIKVGPIIAGLGLLGVAVALGAQDLFKNLISGIMIILEKRFDIGDTINLPGYVQGTVKQIGFRSTLIRKFDSSPISIPNHIFAETPIINFSKRPYRRINWTIGIEYSTSLEQIKTILNEIENYISSNKDFIVDENHSLFVKLDKFNDSSIDLLLYCFTNTNNWSEYLIIKENLSIFIKKIFEKNSVSFAYPSQTIYYEKNDKQQ